MGKKIIKIVIISFLLIVILFIYHKYFSPQAVEGNNNIRNVYKLKLGMDTTEVIKLMGKPYYSEKVSFRGEEILSYSYLTPPLYSEPISVVFDSSAKVIEYGPLYYDDKYIEK